MLWLALFPLSLSLRPFPSLPICASCSISVTAGPFSPSLRAPLSPRHCSPRACAPEAPRWFVSVPRSLSSLSLQASRSVLAALSAGERRLCVEAALPELDPASTAFKYMELLAFVEQLGLGLLEAGALPNARPHVKLLFASSADATLAGGAITYTNLPVSVLGAQTAMGERDGAFILVTPRAGQGIGPPAAIEAAAGHVLAAAGSRPVVLVNPRLGGASPLQSSCKPAYFVRPLTVSYLQDSTAKEMSAGGACLLRCYPHEWSVLIDPKRRGEWSYAGRFDDRPSPSQLEAMVMQAMTGLRNEQFRQNAAAAERERAGEPMNSDEPTD